MLRLDRFLSLYCATPLRRLGTAEHGAIPILMYHSVSDAPESGHPYFWLNTSTERFSAHMQFLSEHGYKVISLADAMKILDTALETSSQGASYRYVVLTFDDGFHDFRKEAWPILADLGFTATVFLATAFIGDTRKSFNGRDCLTWSEARDLQRQGIAFGSHTVSHSRLYGLSWNDIRRELLQSRLRLEDELQVPTGCFSYPYAFPQEDQSYVLRFKQELVDQGYFTAVTTAIGRAERGSDPLCLKRLPVNGADDVRFFGAKLVGGYDWLAGAQAIVRRTKRLSRSRPPFETASLA